MIVLRFFFVECYYFVFIGLFGALGVLLFGLLGVFVLVVWVCFDYVFFVGELWLILGLCCGWLLCCVGLLWSVLVCFAGCLCCGRLLVHGAGLV